MFMKKVITGIAFGVTVLVLAGCGNKAVTTQKPSQNGQTESEQSVKNSVVQKMPAATGKVDDTVSAIIDGANSEGVAATSTDADANAAVGDSQDINNLNSTYDQNAL